MKPISSNRPGTIIDILIVSCLVAVFAITAFSFTAGKIITDVWQQLGMDEKQAKEDINYTFLSGYLYYYGAKDVKNLVAGDRSAIASDILAYTKQYVSSPDFEKEYLQNREREKAKIYPARPAITRDELTRKKIADAETTIATFENLLKDATDPEIVKSYKEQLEFWKKAITDYKSPNSTQIDYELQMDANRYKTEKDTYDQLLKKWETKFPASVKEFTRKRLAEFLDATKDIDYRATLVEKNGRQVFANPVYEKKNWRWKMGFRAGKEATETARSFASNWIKELQ